MANLFYKIINKQEMQCWTYIYIYLDPVKFNKPIQIYETFPHYLLWQTVGFYLKITFYLDFKKLHSGWLYKKYILSQHFWVKTG